MTAKLRISEDFNLSLDILCEKIATLARTGMGKSYTGSVIAEELLKHKQQVCVIDLTDAWWGLRSSADGLRAGFEVYIFGGPHGDVPLSPTSGELMADTIVDTGISAVLSLKSFESNAEETRFVEAFTTRLYRKNRTPIHLFLDEGDQFAPQNPMPEERRCLGAVERIFKRGRINGIGGTILSQRSAAVSKNVLSQAGILIAGQTTDKRDKKAIVDWAEGKDITVDQLQELLQSLPSLKRGTVWVCWPQQGIFRQVKIRERETYDSGKTPKPGEVLREPKRLAPVDLDRLRALMSETVEKAKREDPKLLLQRIHELELQLKRSKAVPTLVPTPAFLKPVKPKIVEVPVLSQKDRATLERTVVRLTTAADALGVAALHTKESAKSIATALAKRTETPTVNVLERRPVPIPAPRPRIVPPAPSEATHEGNGSELTRPQLKILQAAKRLEGLGFTQLRRTWVAPIADTTHASSGYEKNVGTLRVRGLLEYGEPSCYRLTDEGRALAGDVAALDTPEILEKCVAAVTVPMAKLVQALAKAYPEDLSREDLAPLGDTTVASSGFEKNVGSIKTADMATYSGKGRVRCADWIFGQGGGR
jgi:hypothetical protein